MNETQAYRYQLTINNPIEKGFTHSHIKETIINNFPTITYFCIADEIGTQYHTHIFLIFTSRVRFSTIKRHFSTAHIEKCKGNVTSNIDYIKKPGKSKADKEKQMVVEGTFEEWGNRPLDSKGKRGDMTELYQMILEGKTNAEIIKINQDYILQIDKIDKVRVSILSDYWKDKLRVDMEVIYISGDTGTGKTRGVYESNGYTNVYRITDYSHPFDGYNCEKVIFFDEFRSSLKLADMLIYCDIYPVSLPGRYCNRVACYNKVYIVSNLPLEKQYSDGRDRADEETWKAFLRRINKVIIYHRDREKDEYTSVDEYFQTLL